MSILSNQILYMDFSGQYEGCAGAYEDCRNISGTNCYCDDIAKEALRQRILAHPVDAIHFFDSGNYHYISLLWLERIQQDFALVLFDNHPDMKPPSFGNITSCGGWVQEALETLPHLKRVYMVGVDETLLSELEPLPDTVIRGLPADEDLPIYISLDKDVLCETDARCDWSQGAMTIAQLSDALRGLLDTQPILGVDICGEKKDNLTDTDLIINRRTNERLLALLG
ncbi:MAG: arginase [Lachnospiraceae bacterium]|nr:arginase [Lachnospiraceae bacterium]